MADNDIEELQKRVEDGCKLIRNTGRAARCVETQGQAFRNSL
jgi:hypothetical protein